MEENEVKINGEIFEREHWSVEIFLFYWQGDPNFYAMKEEKGKIIEWWFYSDDLPHHPKLDVEIFQTGKRVRQFSEEEFWRRMKLRAFQ